MKLSHFSVALLFTTTNMVSASQFTGTRRITSRSSASNDCVSSNTYDVKAGDTATDISQQQKVSTGAIINVNSLKPDGSDLAADSTICLPLKCHIYTVPAGSSCISVAQTNNISITAFKQYNLDIDGKCTNLIAGYNVCVGPPKWKRHDGDHKNHGD